jgi:hypothetical protein
MKVLKAVLPFINGKGGERTISLEDLIGEFVQKISQ